LTSGSAGTLFEAFYSGHFNPVCSIRCRIIVRQVADMQVKVCQGDLSTAKESC
jgi:hypothetical protein